MTSEEPMSEAREVAERSSPMPDITPEELRESAAYSERKGSLYDAALKRKAADTIERQSARIAELEQQIARLEESLSNFQ